MNRFDVLRMAVVPGALAGLVGGLVFAAALPQLGVLPTIALAVPTNSAVIGVIVHVVTAAIIGAGFGTLVWRQRTDAGETLFWGLAYGMFWWFLGPLTLTPLLRVGTLVWDVHTAQELFPSLVGHILYGAGTALAFVFLRPQRQAEVHVSRGTLLRGMLAGLLAAVLLGAMLDSQGQLLALTMMGEESRLVAWAITLGAGLLAGLGFALLYPQSTEGAGAALIRGLVYGFLWWIASALTLLPLLDSHRLAWTASAARDGFATWPGYLLFGAAVALFYRWFEALVRLLFADDIGNLDDEGPGIQGLRAVGHGLQAGLAGGLLFTLVMVQVGFLPQVARLIGSTSALTGLIVHLLIAIIIGVSYGLLFRRQTYDIGSALGWGISYGLLWWVLGSLTLMPLMLGAAPQWTAEVAASAYPALVGHLLYGAGVGVTFYLLERRSNPWWISRTQAEAIRVTRRKAQVLTSAPALWTLAVAIGLTVPIVLGM